MMRDQGHKLTRAIQGYALADCDQVRRDSFDVISDQFVHQAFVLTTRDLMNLYKGGLRPLVFDEVKAVCNLLGDYVQHYRSYDTSPVVRSIVEATGLVANALIRVDPDQSFPNWSGANEAWPEYVKKTQIRLFETLDDMMQDARTACTPRSLVGVALRGYLYAVEHVPCEEVIKQTEGCLSNMAWLFPERTQRLIVQQKNKETKDTLRHSSLCAATQFIEPFI